MYSREETKKLKEEFWTAYGQYMSAVPSSDLEKVNWVNYKTGVKHLFFRMEADRRGAHIAIELSHPDHGIRALMLAQLVELKAVFTATVAGDWEWDESYYDIFGKEISRVVLTLDKVNVFRKEDWPQLISFFKSNIIRLDEFWSTAKYSFDLFK